MDLVLGKGIKYSCILMPRTSPFVFKLPSFLYKPQSVVLHRQFIHLERHLSCLHQSTNNHIFNNQHGKVLKSNVLCMDVVQYSTTSKPSASTSDASTKSELPNKDCTETPVAKKPSIFQRMKQLTKDYWYILIPVHIATSIGWVSIFYVAVKNGVDIVGILESLNLSEKYLETLRNSSAGHWAFVYALYKIFTPIRYTITVGGTTMCIRYLNRWGYLKFPNVKLEQALKSKRQLRPTYGNPSPADKGGQPQSPKT